MRVEGPCDHPVLSETNASFVGYKISLVRGRGLKVRVPEVEVSLASW